MRSLSLIVILFLTFACSSYRDRISKMNDAEITEQATLPSDQWNRTPVSVRIPRQYLSLEKLTFARVSSQASDADYPAPAQEVKLNIDGDYLLLNDSSSSHTEIVRWKISGKEKEYILVVPVSTLPAQIYFHDQRQADDGIWFHESNSNNAAGLDKTSTIFLMATTGKPEFSRQKPVREIGYLVNYRDSINPMIYNDQGPFNPDNLFITKWHNQRTIQWVISRSVPQEFIPYVIDGITAWNETLPKNLRLSTRLANIGEELDGPFTNAVVYQPSMTNANAAASYTFFPASGEIFRATLVIGKLPAQVNDHGPKLRGSVSHEIGHTLGLRHNFKGSLFDKDLVNFPAGSSIMDYPDQALDSLRKIGPYDRDAIQWAYADSSSTTKYLFCTDEMSNFDPLCQQNDPTSSAPLSIVLDRVRNILVKQIDQSDDLANFTRGKSPFDRVGPYVRMPQSAFYSASTNKETNALFETFLEKASVNPTPVGAQIAARHLQRIVEGAKFVGLSENDLVTALPAFENFKTWTASHPSR